MSEPVINVKSLGKQYRKEGRRSQLSTLKSALLGQKTTVAPSQFITALDDVSFEVARGEAFGVIGPNGSGKSTLLKLVSGILRPTSGTIDVNGRISALIELGAGFHPEISGRENVFINGIMLGLTKKQIERRFDRIADFAGIGEYLDQPVRTYSSGMYVRLGFAVAVHADPDVLLIDEVLSVGDEEFSQKCMARLQEMKEAGTTMLFVTHQLDTVRQFCDRALWLDRGRSASIGDPVRVVDDYLQSVSGTRHAEKPPADAETEEPIDNRGTDLNEEERWGSGEVLLRRVSLVDDRGQQLVALGGESHVVIELDLEAKEKQTDCVFGIGIFHADGTCVYGTNTHIEGIDIQKVEGHARARFIIPALSLIGGRYRIDAAAHTLNGRAYDYRRGVIRFTVGSVHPDVGVYRPAHQWEFIGEIETTEGRKPSDTPAAMRESLRNLEAEASNNDAPAYKKRRRKKDE